MENHTVNKKTSNQGLADNTERLCIDCIKFPGTGKRCKVSDHTVMSYSPICWSFRDVDSHANIPSYD